MELGQHSTTNLEALMRQLGEELNKRRERDGLAPQNVSTNPTHRGISFEVTVVKTMVVKDARTGAECTINMSDFDEAIHEALDEKDAKAAAALQGAEADAAEREKEQLAAAEKKAAAKKKTGKKAEK